MSPATSCDGGAAREESAAQKRRTVSLALGRASTAIEETLPAEQGPVYRLGALSRRPTALGARLVSGPEPVGRPVDLNRRSDGRQLNERALGGRLFGRLL